MQPSQGESSKLHQNLGPKAGSIGSVFQRQACIQPPKRKLDDGEAKTAS